MADINTRRLERIFKENYALEDELAWLKERQRSGESEETLLGDYVLCYQRNPKADLPEYLERFDFDKTSAMHITQEDISAGFELKNSISQENVKTDLLIGWQRRYQEDTVSIRYAIIVTTDEKITDWDILKNIPVMLSHDYNLKVQIKRTK